MLTLDRIRAAYETAKTALLAEMVSEPAAADDPVQKLLDAPVTEFRHWVGELSTSALSTATAVMALEQMRRQYVAVGREVPDDWLALIRGGIDWLIAHQNQDGGWGDTVKSLSNISTTMLCRATLHAVTLAPTLRVGAETSTLRVLTPDAERRDDRSHAERGNEQEVEGNAETLNPQASALNLAQEYIDRAGGVPALIARYGKDHTFSVPILTHCALAGLVDWKEVISLPFELACIPAKFYAAVRLPVVSYALPALIAIGQVRFHFRPSRNPLRRWLQRWAKPASLKVLEGIQPTNGGFLEATPLTSFVTMSLAAMGLHDHPVAQRGIEFIVKSARRDVGWNSVPTGSEESGSGQSPNLRCSWPIDTNLATWVTTLSINALGDDVPAEARPGLRAWLLRQQYRVVHPYTNAAPGGWAWTDLPGGVPDADDTPGAMLALMNLERSEPPARTGEPGGVSPRTTDEHVRGLTPSGSPNDGVTYRQVSTALIAATRWLLGLQNRDGGCPTFCRGWGTLPFDRSSPDITAHCIRALLSGVKGIGISDATPQLFGDPVREGEFLRQNRGFRRFDTKLAEGVAIIDADEMTDWCVIDSTIAAIYAMRFLKRAQRPDGSWLPLWFGNQHAPNDENPTYGTAKVLAAFQALGRMSDESAVRGVRWLVENQNPDGGWGAGPGTPSSIEETALALEALFGTPEAQRLARLVPTLRVGTPAPTLCVTSGSASADAERPDVRSHAERGNEVDLVDAIDVIPHGISRGLSWLIPRVEDGRFREPAPIGFYFAKLWYFERLYPVIFTVAALRRAVTKAGSEVNDDWP